MQLILDSEASIDLHEKMSAIEETTDFILKVPTENIKSEISNGNKENIHHQENIINGSDDVTNGDEKEEVNVPSPSVSDLEELKLEDEDDTILEDQPQEDVPVVENTCHKYDLESNNESNGDCDSKNKTLDADAIPLRDEKVVDVKVSASIITIEKSQDNSNSEEEKVKVSLLEEKNDTLVKLDDEPKITTETVLLETVVSNEFDNTTEVINEIDNSKDKKKEEDEEPKTEIHNNNDKEKEEEPKSEIDYSKDKEEEEELKPEIDYSKDKEKEKEEPKTKELSLENKNEKTSETIEICPVDENIEINIDTGKETVPSDAETKPSSMNGEAEKSSETPLEDTEIDNNADQSENNLMNCDDALEDDQSKLNASSDSKMDVSDTELVKGINEILEQSQDKPETEKPAAAKQSPIKSKLSNTLDILSDEEEEVSSNAKPQNNVIESTEKQCINIEDDDDIMLIDEVSSKEVSTSAEDFKNKSDLGTETKALKKEEENTNTSIDVEKCKENADAKNLDAEDQVSNPAIPDSPALDKEKEFTNEAKQKNENSEERIKTPELTKPLIAENFMKSCKKNLVDMTREELEEFCILKIVESIVDRSNLSEIKTKLKAMALNIEEYKKKAMMLTKQNRDLQVVLKSVQEEQKKKTDTQASHVTPLKITRSVGMQVLMITEKSGMRKKFPPNGPNTNNNVNNRAIRPVTQSPRPQKPASNQQIPVPRLVPANNPVVKTTGAIGPVAPVANYKTASPIPNGIKVGSPAPKPQQQQQQAEKRPLSRSVSDCTVDLTDDEPPAKITPRSSPAPPVRLVSPQNLLAPQRPQFGSTLNCPRKVYIPISGNTVQNVRQTVMMTGPVPRQRCPPPHLTRMPQNAIRMPRMPNHQAKHPAPLPESMKQYQPPNWKALPPAPDLKLSKVENGIVISWKIDGYEEDSYEEIASYQLYAYQETKSSPPNTSLWKKIGDVKALPLPMACTLTQFMAGFKYYFAVRAVDVRSRLGPFSLPGSIQLFNKM